MGVQGTFCCLDINIDLISLEPCGEMESFRSLLSKNLEALLNPHKAISPINFFLTFLKSDVLTSQVPQNFQSVLEHVAVRLHRG